MKKKVKDYGKRTIDAAKKFGYTRGWKKLSYKRIRIFLDLVYSAMGYVNISSIELYAEKTFQIYQREISKLVEAARVFGKKEGWERITENRINEFYDIFLDYCKKNGIINPDIDDAMDFAYSYKEGEIDEDDYDIDDDEEYEDVRYWISEEREAPFYIITGAAGWDDSDTVDNVFYNNNFFEATIVDSDGTIVYNGNDRRDFWDAFRELSDGISYPIYDAYTVDDKFGNKFLELVVTGYYP